MHHFRHLVLLLVWDQRVYLEIHVFACLEANYLLRQAELIQGTLVQGRVSINLERAAFGAIIADAHFLCLRVVLEDKMDCINFLAVKADIADVAGAKNGSCIAI